MSNNAKQTPTSATESHHLCESGQESRHESHGTHAPGSGATFSDNHTGAVNLNITATMGTETIGTARVSEAGSGPSQPKRGTTQHERNDLLRGMGSQFDSVSGHASNGAHSTVGHEYR